MPALSRSGTASTREAVCEQCSSAPAVANHFTAWIYPRKVAQWQIFLAMYALACYTKDNTQNPQ